MPRKTARSAGWPKRLRASINGATAGRHFEGCRFSRLRPEAASLCFGRVEHRDSDRWVRTAG